MSAAEEVYRIIPDIHSLVNRELLIQKYTGKTTTDWVSNYIRKGEIVRMIFTSNDKPPRVSIVSSWNCGTYEIRAHEQNNKYVKLRENGKWMNYKPLVIPERSSNEPYWKSKYNY